MSRLARRIVAIAFAIVAIPAFAALVADDLKPLADDEAGSKLAAVERLVESGDARVAAILQALRDDALAVTRQGVFVIAEGEGHVDALTGAAVSVDAAALESISINNRIRGRIDAALAAFDLLSPDRATRAGAIAALEKSPDPVLAKLIDAAASREPDAELKARLALLQAALRLASGDRATRLEAITQLGASENPATRLLLLPFVERTADGSFREPDAELRAAAERAIRSIDAAQRKGELAGAVFTGLSLGSVLLLAALGLAITYGLMGVINMAHGELMMIGAYATYVVQNLFRTHFPGAFDAYVIAAIPVSFLAAAAVGAVLERSVIRWLYGRPLETLLATWGISLILMQAVRNLFGAQNVPVENPAWLSGGWQVMSNLTLPYNRIAIIAFAMLVLAGVAALIAHTRLGLFVRGVTQNRKMAACMGVNTARVDTYAFALGSGIAGLAGCALSQVGNVGPDLGQSYIVDSFMVVVLGGVGQLAGTVYAALGLGVLNKLLEGWQGAVLAKIMVLVFIVIFIQKRPQGIFAMKGRSAEA